MEVVLRFLFITNLQKSDRTNVKYKKKCSKITRTFSNDTKRCDINRFVIIP